MSKPTQADDERTCPHCGKRFTPRHGSQRYCTNRKDGPGNCQKLAEQEREKQRGYRRPKVAMTCHHCGTEFMGEIRQRRPGSHEHYYCSHRCYSDYRRFKDRKHFVTTLDWRDCTKCDSKFIYRHGRKKCKTCLDEKSHARFTAGLCAECRAPFVGKWHPLWPAKYCDDACAKRASRKEQRKKIGHCGTHRQRARKLGVAYEWVNRRQVFERDKYVCGICGLKTEPESPSCSPRYPTLDHILPMSLGGGHTYANLQCACFECNWLKSNNPPDEAQQMQLGLYLVA